MSTAYPPRFIRYILSSQRERDAARSSAVRPAFYGDFPSTFGLYYAEPGRDYLSQRFTLSTVDNGGAAATALHTVTFHKGPGSRQMTLHSASDVETPMVIGTNERRFGSSATIKLPGRDPDQPLWTERLRSGGLGSNKYSFDFDGDSFEWLEDISTRPRTRRLRKKDPATDELPSDKSGRVLATWTEGSVPNRHRQLAVFRLLDDDAAVQRLDERWMLLAVSTALVICQQGPAVEGTMTWQEEKMLERGAYQR